MVKFEVKATFPVSARTIYEAWLDSEQHSDMTGGEAICSDQTGGSFTAWDGYISGINLKLTPYSEIVQSWRTTEFSEDEENSLIEISLTDTDAGCELVMVHSNIPEGQSDYESGWFHHYFEPMAEYFA